MKAIAVDDEIYMMETLQESVIASSDIEMVDAFSSCSAALAYATENPVDIAFLDINMRGIGGLGLKRKKAKEFLAVLIDRNGAGMTAKQICAILFPEDTDDTKNAAYLRQLVLDLKNTLKTIRAEDVLKHDTPYYRIDTNLVRCDYLSFLETGKPEFHGEYMTQYSWAEETCALLQFKK